MTTPDADTMPAEMWRAVRALVRNGLSERGQLEELQRFADPDAWTVRLLGGETYYVTWRADGEPVASIPVETVLEFVALQRGLAAARKLAADAAGASQP